MLQFLGSQPIKEGKMLTFLGTKLINSEKILNFWGTKLINHGKILRIPNLALSPEAPDCSGLDWIFSII